MDKPADADGITRDYPEYYQGINKYLRVNQERSIGLLSLENGSPFFQIRIFKDFNDRTGWLLVLTDSLDHWHATLFNFKYVGRNYIPDSLSAQIIFTGAPQSGWESFIHKLANSDILTLPDAHSLKNYDIGSDETVMIVEIADKNHFRHYEYSEPYYRQNTFKEAKKAVQILELLQREFPIDKKFRQKELE